MLIRDQAEQDTLKITRHKNCAWCKRELLYPRIVAPDATNTSYHVPCAQQLARELLSDVQDLLNDPHVGELAKRIEFLTLAQRPSSPARAE